MKNEVIKQFSTPDLIERLEEERKQLTRMKINHAVSPLENPMKLKEYKKVIARLQTELRTRQLRGEDISTKAPVDENKEKQQ
jgi:large subunit ribosomal protein L29